MLAPVLHAFDHELDAVEHAVEPDGEELIIAWRRLVYEATELFDAYTNLLPQRVTKTRASKEYTVITKRLHSFCAKATLKRRW